MVTKEMPKTVRFGQLEQCEPLPKKRQVAFEISFQSNGSPLGSARIGCGHDVLNQITEGGNGIGKCIAKVPRFISGAGDALKLFFPVSTYALN